MFTIQFISAARAPPCVAPHPIMQLLLQCGDSRRILFQPALQVVIDFVRVAFGDTVEAYIVQWKRIWWILCSVCISTLWIQRNRVVHEHLQLSLQGSVRKVCANGLRQLRALSARERRKLHSRVQGIRLWQCIEILDASTAPSRASHPVVSHVRPPDHSTPALLRTFQRSCTR